MQNYLENARRVLALAESGKGSGRLDRPCKDCVYHDAGFLGSAIRPKCTNPIVKLAAAQTKGEYDMNRISTAADQRSESSPFGTIVCGPDGALFEPR